MATGQFTKKTVDIEALMAQAAALEAEEKAAAAKSPPQTPKPPKPTKPASQKKPSEPKNKEKKKEAKNKAKVKRKVFGVPLADIELEKREGIPSVYGDIIRVLESFACETQGLFRVTASTAAIDELIRRYEAGEEIDWNKIEDKHLVGGVLMAFLLRLPEPLFPFAVYDSLIQIADNKEETEEEKCRNYFPIIKQLPLMNYRMLAELMDFLDTLTRDADDNMMTASNLAICFAPALLRREKEDLQQLMKESPLVNDVITILVDQFEYFFRGGKIDLQTDAEPVEEVVDENEESPSSPVMGAEELKAFVHAVLSQLDTILKRIISIENNLEWSVLWDQQALQNVTLTCTFLKRVGDIISLSVADIEAAVTAPPSTRASLVPFKCPEKKSQVHQLYLILSDRRMYIQENLVDQDSLLKICRTTKCATVLLDWLEPQLKTEIESAKAPIQKEDAVDLVPQIKKQLRCIKRDLQTCEEYDQAVLISRIIRAAQKALKENILSPLQEVDWTASGGKTDTRKIQLLQDNLEFSFTLCEKMLTRMLKELNSSEGTETDCVMRLQLLVELESVFHRFVGERVAELPEIDLNFTATKPKCLDTRRAPAAIASARSNFVQRRPQWVVIQPQNPDRRHTDITL